MTAEKRIGIIIQARMGSKRLQGKVLMNIDENLSVLELLIRRVKLSKFSDCIIIATTPDDRNLEIIEIAKKFNLFYFIGSEENVLERYYNAALKFSVDIIIRITSDCPFVDPTIIDEMILFFQENAYDYIMNLDIATNFPAGFDTEIFSFKALETIYRLSKTKKEKEHVTIFVQNRPELFSIFYFDDINLKVPENLRLTIDYKEDIFMIREVYKKLKENGKNYDFNLQDVLDIVEKNPKIMNINKKHKK